MSEASSPVPIELDVAAVRQKLDQGEICLIDCREPGEFEVAKIEGAVLLPMSRWGEVVGDLAEHVGGRPIVVYCHHGMRSRRVTEWLRANGFPDAQNMTGGIDLWSQVIDPSVPQY